MLNIMLGKGFFIDGIRWVIGEHPPKAIPLCPKDYIKLDSYHSDDFLLPTKSLKCEECDKIYFIPRELHNEEQYVLNKLNSRKYKLMSFVNLDDEMIPIAEDKKSSKNNKFFVVSRLMESKTGIRLVVYAGEKGKKEKTQIFVEPEIKRLAFDQKDLHPTEVFTKLEATFSDGTKASQEKTGIK